MQIQREEITFPFSHAAVTHPLAFLPPTVALIFSVSHNGSAHLNNIMF